jgi:hypothetical protein
MITRVRIPQRRYSTSKLSWKQKYDLITYKDIPTLSIFAAGVNDYDAAISDRNTILSGHFDKLFDAHKRIADIIVKECIPTTELLVQDIKSLCSDDNNIVTSPDSIINILPALEKQADKLRYLAATFGSNDIPHSSIKNLEEVPSVKFVIVKG